MEILNLLMEILNMSDIDIVIPTQAAPKKKARYKKCVTANGELHPVHLAVWEQVHGPIPRGMCVHHIDRNPRNNDIKNLALVTRAEHTRIHAAEMLAARRGVGPRWPKKEEYDIEDDQ